MNKDNSVSKDQIADAWQTLMPQSSKPLQIEIIEESGNGRIVVRLFGVGPGGSNVIAKQSHQKTFITERTIYEDVLPYLPVSRLHYYGSVIDQVNGYSWLYLEDVSAEKYHPHIFEHRVAAAHWIGTMNTSVLNIEEASQLPNRGPVHYLGLLNRGVNSILSNDSNPALELTDHKIIEKSLANCEILKADWDQLTNICDEIPSTLIHGDFISKNVAVRTSMNGLTILPFDWEKAGWGCPAEDISRIDIPTYQSTIQDCWPEIGLYTLKEIAKVGRIFRCLVYMDWIAPQLQDKTTVSPMNHLRLCESWLTDLIQDI